MLPSELENFFNKSGLKVARYSRGEFSIYCPFHDDSTASLFVNPVRGLFHCFAGCVKGSNGIASLLKKVETGLDIQFMMQFPDLIIVEEEEEDTKIDINLDKLPLATLNDYLRRRHITEETIKEFNIKYHLGYDALIVPINDRQGNLVSYLRRNLNTNPRYMNAKGTLVSQLLFPYDRFEAREGQLVVVEGVFDAIRAHQEGFTNTVSTLGGQIRRGQLKILMEYAREIVLCPDRDKEGVIIAERNVQLLERYGVPYGFTRPLGAAKDLAESTKVDLVVTPSFILDFGQKSIKNFLGVR